MGLFDWLSDAMGSGANPMGGGDPAQMLTRSSNVMDRPQPSLDLTGGVGAELKPPQAPLPLGADPMSAGGAPPNGPGLPPAPPPMMPKPADMAAGPDPTGAPPVPMPQPRPPGADAGGGPLPPPPPPPVQPPSGGMPGAAPAPPVDLASAAQSYQRAGGNLAPPPDAGGPGNSGMGPISRALGLDPNQAKSMRGSLAAGMTAAGNSAGKSPFQAATSGAGAALEGGDKATDKTYDQKIKYLQAAVAAQSAGDKAAYNKNYASYLAGKLKSDTDKAASGKSGSWNKPDSQKFIDAQHALASDPEVRASQKLLEQSAKTADPAEIAKAQAAHTALIQSKEAKYLAGVGLDPAKTADLAKNPPGTPQNPHVVTSQSDFDTYVKPGQAYRNPRDGKVYIRKGGGAAKGGDSGEPEPAAVSAPAAPGPPPNPMGAGPPAAADDEE